MFVVVAIVLAVFLLPPPWGWVAIAVGLVAEIAETVVWMRLLRRHPPSAGADALIGAMARTTTACRPIGAVNVRGEAWRARCDAGADAGERVRVLSRDGITLVVEPLATPYPETAGR